LGEEKGAREKEAQDMIDMEAAEGAVNAEDPFFLEP
jgi:hypothetical protein